MKRAFLSLLMAGVPLAAPAFAQSASESLRPGGVLPAGLAGPMEPADRLAMSLRMLSQNPYDVGALTQAGESALAVGDANAAISFLARAEELSPSSGRIKASLGGALVLVERPADSFRLFAEAVSLGVPEHQLARDRGLAYDLTGDPRRAQRDYVLALRHGADDETVRRYALSLGVSGEKDQALKQLEPLIRKRDQGAWRARAFVLAMNGDERGAVRIAEQVMTPDMTPTFITFARRLALLTPAQKAAAVNFGTMPSTDMRMAQASTGTAFRPINEALESVDPAPARAVPIPVVDPRSQARAKRRRPGRDEVQTALALPQPQPIAAPAPAPAVPRATPSAPRTETVTPTWSEARTTRRVGERIAAIDPTLLPPEARGVSPAGVRAVLQPALRDLPTPTPADRVASAPLAAVIAARQVVPEPVAPAPAPIASVAAVGVPAVQAVPAALVKPVETPTPAPVFEIPKAPAVQTPVQVVAQPPAPLPTAPLPTAPVVALAPKVETAPPPVAAAQNVEAAQVQTAVVTPPAPVPTAPAPIPVSVTPTPAAVVTPPAPGFSDAVVPTSAPPVQTLAAMTVTPLPAPVAPTPLPATPILEPVPAQVQGPVNPNPAAPPSVAVAAAPSPAEPAEAPVAGLGSVLAGLSLETESTGGPVLSEAEFRRARLAAKRKAEAEAGADSEAKLAADAKAKEEAETLRIAKANPERIWVQVATGSNRAGLSGTLSKLRDTAPDALKGVGGASIPFKATNRVLVGPFKTQTEARAVINKLAKKGVSATSYTSSAGQEVNKLPSR